MIKYSPNRFGIYCNPFCRFIPIIRGNVDEVVSYMEQQNYIKYLKYKIPRKFGGDGFRDLVERCMRRSWTHDFISTNGFNLTGTGRLNYILVNKCLTIDSATGEIKFDSDAFRDTLHEACQITNFREKEFLIPYRLENLISEEQWCNVAMPIIYQYFGHSDGNVNICDVAIEMPDA